MSNSAPYNVAKTGPVLRGKKVLLRPFRIADLTDLYIQWLCDPDVTRFSNQRFVSHTRDSCTEYLASFEGSKNIFLSIQQLSDGNSIGTLTAYISDHHGTADVGIMIGAKLAWGKGYGQDAWDCVLGWLLSRHDIRKVTAGTLACNQSMIKIAYRSGMHLEGRRRAQEIVGGVPVDTLLFARFETNGGESAEIAAAAHEQFEW